ncbi:MAG: phosphoribosylglycinamide formyltransferase [Candidatus Eisenbacteria bacterium]
MRVGVLVSGRGSNLQALLDAQAVGTLGAEVVVVLSDQPDALALRRAEKAGVPAIHVPVPARRARMGAEIEEQFVSLLREHRVDWVVLAGFFRIVGERLLRAYPDRILNIHPSLLPSFPGLHAQQQALEHGARVTGCTVHLVDSGVDSGAILDQRTVSVLQDDTEESLSSRILVQEHLALPAAIERIAKAGFRREGRRVFWNDGDEEQA